ncbi:MAG: zinc-binding dehydrogenase [Bacteroidota bacterium]
MPKRYTLEAGNLANMRAVEFELPVPKSDEVSIAVKAIGLNFADVFAIWGLYGATPEGSFTPGLEYAGVVERVGSDVSHLKPGDRVMGVTRFGAYTTHLNIDARYAIPLPQDWSFEQGAAYLVQTLTAYYGMVHLGAMQKNQAVLIHSAAGGVGLQAVQIARAYNCYTIGTVGSESKVEFALGKGYDKVIVRGKNFKDDLKAALEGKPLELVMDSVGGDYFTIPFRMLAPMGRVIVFGSARYAAPGDKPNKWHMLKLWLRRPKIDPQILPEKNKGVLGFNLIWLYERAWLMHQLLKELEALNLDAPHVGHIFPFEQLPDSVRLFQTGKTVGKVVVTV